MELQQKLKGKYMQKQNEKKARSSNVISSGVNKREVDEAKDKIQGDIGEVKELLKSQSDVKRK